MKLFAFLLLLSVGTFSPSAYAEEALFNRIWTYSPLQIATDSQNRTVGVKTFARIVRVDRFPFVTTQATFVEATHVKDSGTAESLARELTKSFPDIASWRTTQAGDFVEFEADWPMIDRNLRLLWFKKGDRSFTVIASSNNAFKQFHRRDVDVLFEVFKRYGRKPGRTAAFFDQWDGLIANAYAQNPLDIFNAYFGGAAGGATGTDPLTAVLNGNSVQLNLNVNATPDAVTATNQYAVGSAAINAASQNGVTISQNGLLASQNAVIVSENGVAVSQNALSASQNLKDGMVTASQNGLEASKNVVTASDNLKQGIVTASENGVRASEIIQSSVHETNETLKYLVRPEVVMKAAFAGACGVALAGLAINLAKDALTTIGTVVMQMFDHHEEKIAWADFQAALQQWRGESDKFVAGVRGDYQKLLPMQKLLAALDDTTMTPEDLTSKFKKDMYLLKAEKLRLEKELEKADTNDTVCVAQTMAGIDKLGESIEGYEAVLKEINTRDSIEALRAKACINLTTYKASLVGAMKVTQSYRTTLVANSERAMQMVSLQADLDERKAESSRSSLKHTESTFFDQYRKISEGYAEEIQACVSKALGAVSNYSSMTPEERSRVRMAYRGSCVRKQGQTLKANLDARLPPNLRPSFATGPYLESLLDVKNAAYEAKIEQDCFAELDKRYPPHAEGYPTRALITGAKIPECQDPLTAGTIDLFLKSKEISKLIRDQNCHG